MRLAVIVGEDVSGKWMPIALPDKAVAEQRRIYKEIKHNKGLISSGKKATQFKKIMYFDSYCKRAFFHRTDAPATPPEIMV